MGGKADRKQWAGSDIGCVSSKSREQPLANEAEPSIARRMMQPLKRQRH